jgi:predicted O-methyltransferase YrrM
MVWIAENMAAGEYAHVFCIDTWAGGEEHGNHDMAAVEARFDHNVKAVEARKAVTIAKLKGKSSVQLASLVSAHEKSFDFVYIDGSHIARDVLTDACLAWALLKPGGIMLFDDYLWGGPRDILHRPKLAVDAFINAFSEQLDIVHLGYQAAVKKKEI